MSKKHITISERLMQLGLVKKFLPFYEKNREILLYLFFGGTAFFLNIALFWLLGFFIPKPLLNNCICWVVCVLYQFVTNKKLVFQKESEDSISKQLLKFTGGRVFTLVIEEIILAVGIKLLEFSEMPVKLAAQVIVIVLNYIISKWFVFM